MAPALTLDDVRDWLHRELATLARASPIRAWSPVEGGFGTSVRIELAEGSVRLAARPKDAHPGWLELATVTLNVDAHADPIPPSVHAFLQTLAQALRGADG